MSGPMAGVDFDGAYAAKTRGPAAPAFSLGQKMEDADGNVFIFVQANGAITANDVVIITEAFQADQADTTNSATAFGDLVGIAKGTLADDEYGWMQVYGQATANVANSCAANTTLNTTATAGRLDDDATTGAEAIDGLVLTTAAAADGTTAPATLNYPTVGATLS